MKNIVIRRPNNSDINELHQFFNIVVNNAFGKEGLGQQTEDINNEVEVKKKYLKEDLLSNGETRYFLLACYKDTIVGTIEYGYSNPYINECVQNTLDNVIEIGTIFVLPEYQGKGIGNILISSMLVTLQSRNIHEFCLDSGYGTAQKVWTKKFGKADFVIKDFWGEGADHMIWHRYIDNRAIYFKI